MSMGAGPRGGGCRLVVTRPSALAALSLAFVAGCELHQGQVYPAGGAPRYDVTRTCESTDSAGASPLRVVVLDPSKVPVADATVRVGEANGVGPAARVETDSKGEAEVGVAAGRWEIEVTATALAPARYVVELPAGQACVLRFTLKRGEDAFPF
jgi:hypothetical protein